MRTLPLLTALILATASQAAAQSGPGDPNAGLELARQQCSECHFVEREWADMEVMFAPDFIDIAASEHNAQSLRVFLRTPHATMPNIILTDRERDDIVSYIMSLEIQE